MNSSYPTAYAANCCAYAACAGYVGSNNPSTASANAFVYGRIFCDIPSAVIF